MTELCPVGVSRCGVYTVERNCVFCLPFFLPLGWKTGAGAATLGCEVNWHGVEAHTERHKIRKSLGSWSWRFQPALGSTARTTDAKVNFCLVLPLLCEVFHFLQASVILLIYMLMPCTSEKIASAKGMWVHPEKGAIRGHLMGLK